MADDANTPTPPAGDTPPPPKPPAISDNEVNMDAFRKETAANASKETPAATPAPEAAAANAAKEAAGAETGLGDKVKNAASTATETAKGWVAQAKGNFGSKSGKHWGTQLAQGAVGAVGVIIVGKGLKDLGRTIGVVSPKMDEEGKEVKAGVGTLVQSVVEMGAGAGVMYLGLVKGFGRGK